METPVKAIVAGTGYALPQKVRQNSDPIFDYLHKNQPPGSDLFKGYSERRVLDKHESLVELMANATENCLQNAGLSIENIDFILGTASPSEYATPNGVAQLHQLLGARQDCGCIPISDDFTNAVTSILLAQSLIESGRASHVLVCCGCGWSRCSNYMTPQAISSGDGAGAVVISKHSSASAFQVLDSETFLDTTLYGGMYLNNMQLHDQEGTPVSPPAHAQPDSLMEEHLDQRVYSAQWYAITDEGRHMFKGPGMNAPVKVVKTLLERNTIASDAISLLTHQASSVLMSHWGEQINPGEYPDTLAKYANMTVASLLVNFAIFRETLTKKHLVMVGVGPMFQSTAVLFSRL